MHCTRLATQQASSSSMAAPVSRLGSALVAGPTACIPVRPRARQLSANGGALCRKATLTCRAIPGRLVAQPTVSAAGVSHPGEEREGTDAFASLSVPTTAMAKGLGSSGNSATLQRSKLSNSQKVTPTGPKLDDGMGGGGLGGKIFNGGGGDGGDDDDDDYFNEGDDGGDGDGNGFFRKVFGELYDAASIQAVLQEWYKTMADLPLILRQAAQMGLFSSAALVRFMAMDVRPNVTRFVTRSLPPSVSREVVGRLMADPAFMQKLVLEQMITITASLAYEARVRGDRFMSELDLVAANTLSLAAANAALVYLVAPTRAAPAPARFEWQNLLAKLPNNVFDRTTPLRAYSTSSRVAAFFVKSAELCGVGMLAGAAQAALGRAAVALRRRGDPAYQPSVAVPSVRQSALGMAAAYGIFANSRYQIVAGVDRYLFDHANFIWSYLFASGVFRAISTNVGDATRVYLQGLPKAPSFAEMAAAAAQQQRLQQYRAHQAQRAQLFVNEGTPLGAEGSAAAAAGGKRRKRRSSKQAGFEMGVGPAPAPAPAMA